MSYSFFQRISTLERENQILKNENKILKDKNDTLFMAIISLVPMPLDLPNFTNDENKGKIVSQEIQELQ